MIVTLLVALVLAIVSVIFALQNAYAVKVTFFALETRQPFALFILASLGVGALIGILVMLPGVIRRSITLTRQRKQIEGLNKSLKEAQMAVVPPPPPITTPPAEPAAPAAPPFHPASEDDPADEAGQIEE